MSPLSIQVPFPVFQDRDGQPLDNGYVWIGEANLNPQTNPVIAYYDSDLTIVAPQPLRTLNGYISRSGTPAQVYVDGVNFSILVQDSKGSMVYNFPDGTGIGPQAAGVSFFPPGGGAVTNLQARGENVIYVTDYANLAVMTAARDPIDPNSHLLLNFLNWTPAIQAAFDEADSRGGGTVILNKNTVPYYVQDPVVIKSNTIVIFNDWIVLADFNFIGNTLSAYGDNITVYNCQIDNSDIFAGGSGYNGFAVRGEGVKFIGGYIKNCHRGEDFITPGSPNDGGKGVQIESGDSFDITISDMTFENCFMAMSTIRDFGTVNPYNGIVYNNIIALDCKIFFFVRQANGYDQTGLGHAIQINNFYAKNCGAFEGVIQLSRASNVLVSNGIVVNDPAVSTTSLIRGNHANCQFVNVGFYGNTNTVINLDASTYAPDSSNPNRNNRYEIQVWGQVATLVDAGILTPFRTINNCFGSFMCRLDPSTGWFGNEIRNGTSAFTLTQDNKIFHAVTNLNFFGNGFGNPVKFSDLSSSLSIDQNHAVRLANFNLTNPDELDWYEEGNWTPTFEADSGSGAIYTSTGTYTRVGREVTVAGLVTPTNFGTLSGRVRIGGLPFINTAAPGKFGGTEVSFLTIVNPAGLACAIGTVSNTQITFPWSPDDGTGGDNVRIADVVAGSSIFRFSVTYFAA